MTELVTLASLLGGSIIVVLLVLYGPGGQYAPYALLALSALAIPYALFVRQRAPWRIDGPSLAFAVAFVLITVAYWLAAKNKSDVLIVANFGWLLLFAPVQSVLKRLAAPNAATSVARLALLGTAATFVFALYEHVQFDVSRVGRLSSDPIRIANSAVILGFLSLMGLKADRGMWRLVYLAGPALAVGVALLAETRGAISSAGILAVIATLLLVRRKGLAVLIGLGLAIVAAAALVIGARYHIARIDTLLRSVQQMLAGETISNNSAKIRLAMLKAAWGAFQDSPLFGHGWQKMMKVIVAYLPEGQKTLTRGQPHLHNDVADFAVSAGLLGLVAYATILVTPLLAAWRGVRDVLYAPRLFGATMLVASYAALGINALMFGYEVHTAMYCGLAAILLGYVREQSPFAVAATAA